MEALEKGIDSIRKYDKLIFVQPRLVPYPPEIALGFKNFCSQFQISYDIIHEVEHLRKLNKKEAYLVIEETDLVNLINSCKASQFSIGSDVGIISFNDTPLKSILLDGITVISTDHARMGETA